MLNNICFGTYIDDLEALKTCILKANTDTLIPLHIFTQEHSIVITYDKDTDRWLCGNMSQLPLKFYNTQATAHFIQKAFPTSGLALSYFMPTYAKEAVSNIIKAWEETDAFKKHRTLTTDRKHYAYHLPFSKQASIPLFDMAVHANDVATIKVLCEKFQQNPNTPVGIRFNNHPVHAAARFGHYETFKYLLEHPLTIFRPLSLQSRLCNTVIKRGNPDFLLVFLEHVIRKFEPSSIGQFVKEVLNDQNITDDATLSLCQTLHEIDSETYKLHMVVQNDSFRSERFKIQLTELTADKYQSKYY
jgi:hypothetical protein